MKNLIITVLLFVSLAITAQESSKIQNTIDVVGSVKFKRNITAYRIKVILSLEQLSYGNSECNTFEELKERYFKKLENKGIDTQKLKENKLEYLGMYYRKDGMVYMYETSSKEDVLKVLSVRVNGVTNSSLEYQVGFDDKQYDKLVEEAISIAKVKANRIAKKTNRKIGKIARISDTSSLETTWVFYIPQNEFLQFGITFELL